MKKHWIVILALGIALLSLVSCSPIKQANGDSTAAGAIADPDSGSTALAPPSSDTRITADTTTSSGTTTAVETAISQSSTETNSIVTESPAPAENQVNTGVTLEAVKKAAQDAGFQVEDNPEMQQRVEPKPVNGFTVNYRDETIQSQIPVYEFASPSDALQYAGKVNDSGYNLSVVNGKLLAVTGSRYGVVTNDKETAWIEKTLQSKVMAMNEPGPVQAGSEKDYAGAASRINAIYKTLDRLVNKSALVYGKTQPADDPKNLGNVSFSMLSSPDLAFTSVLNEDPDQMDAIVKTWELYGCTDVKLKHNAPNDYTLSGKRAGMDTSFSIHCVYSPDKDSLQILDKDGDATVEFFEFVPLDADIYAFQSLYERAIVEYRDGKILSFVYSVRERTKENAYKPASDSIYPEGKHADQKWVSDLGEDKYEQFVAFDGTTLRISAEAFTGEKINAEIPAQ